MNISTTKAKLQGKKTSHRRAVVRSLVLELIRNNHLKTTPAKARILTAEFDRLVSEAKKNTFASKRNVFSQLQNELAMNKLYDKLLPELQDVNSGYTYKARTLPRKGDNADQVIVLIRGTEIKERQSRLERALARRDGAKTDEKPKRAARQPKADRQMRDTTKAKDQGKKKESLADTRRVST